jgi:outer membrane beta-barrel protein
MRRTIGAVLALGLALAPANAFADELDDLLDLGGDDTEQSDGAAAGDSDDGAAVVAGDPGAGAPSADAAPAKRSGVIDPRDETIFAIQKKGRYIANRWELSLMGARSINDKFTTHVGGLVNGIYHFAETMSVEIQAGMLQGGYTGTTTELLELKSLTPPGADYALMSWYVGTDVQWAPIYGKFRLAGKLLGHFDIYMGVGVGLTQSKIKQISKTTNEVGENSINLSKKIVSNLGGGLRFYFTDRFGVRVEVRDYIVAHGVPDEYNDTDELEVGGKVQNSVDIANTLLFQVGPSFVF